MVRGGPISGGLRRVPQVEEALVIEFLKLLHTVTRFI